MNPSTRWEMQGLVIPLWPKWGCQARAAALPSLALAEERREVLEGVLDGLRASRGDSGVRSACRFLLRHLAASAPGS